MITAFLIFAREVLEGTLVVSILLAYLAKTNQKRYWTPVLFGVATAILMSVLGAIIIYHTVRAYVGTPLQNVFEGATYLLAAIILTGMTLWMHKESRSLSGDLRARVDQAMAGGGSAGTVLFLLALLTVGREGLETAVLTVAIVMVTPTLQFVAGAVLGSLVSIGIAYLIFAMGQRINIGKFLSWLSILLAFFAAGLLVDAAGDFQVLGWIGLGREVLWSSARWLSDSSLLGDVLHSFLGYSDTPTALQVSLYTVYLAIFAFVWRKDGKKPKQTTRMVRN